MANGDTAHCLHDKLHTSSVIRFEFERFKNILRKDRNAKYQKFSPLLKFLKIFFFLQLGKAQTVYHISQSIYDLIEEGI